MRRDPVPWIIAGLAGLLVGNGLAPRPKTPAPVPNVQPWIEPDPAPLCPGPDCPDQPTPKPKP